MVLSNDTLQNVLLNKCFKMALEVESLATSYENSKFHISVQCILRKVG